MRPQGQSVSRTRHPSDMGRSRDQTQPQPGSPTSAQGRRVASVRGRRNACWELPLARFFQAQSIDAAEEGPAQCEPRGDAEVDCDGFHESPEPHRQPRRQRRNAVYEIDPADLPPCAFRGSS